MTVSECIFCKIANKEIDSHIVYENDSFLAFLDIDPQSPGHTQVIPKKHYRWVWQVPNAGEYFEVVKKIALAQQKAFNTDWILSKIIGDEIPHAHIWVFPALPAGRPDPSVKSNPKNLEGNAEKIKQALK